MTVLRHRNGPELNIGREGEFLRQSDDNRTEVIPAEICRHRQQLSFNRSFGSFSVSQPRKNQRGGPGLPRSWLVCLSASTPIAERGRPRQRATICCMKTHFHPLPRSPQPAALLVGMLRTGILCVGMLRFGVLGVGMPRVGMLHVGMPRGRVVMPVCSGR